MYIKYKVIFKKKTYLHSKRKTKQSQLPHRIMFTGKLQIKVCEASGLRPTDFQKRHNLTFGKLADEQLIDPYVSIDVDDNHFGKYFK